MGPGAGCPQPQPSAPPRGEKDGGFKYHAALKNEALVVFGDGEQSSDFVFIDDIVDACMRAPGIRLLGRSAILARSQSPCEEGG